MRASLSLGVEVIEERHAGSTAGSAGGSAKLVGPKANESTLGLPEAGERASESASEGDLPHLQAGEQLAGRFVVLRFIASGGMAAVYEANDVMLRTRVALKVLHGELPASALERFQREVLLARRVSHPNVCRVYEFYQSTLADGLPIHFLTMEYLEGETLAARLAREGRLSAADALPLVKQMCEGLAAAHAEGVLHRDFKSSNVMLVQRVSDAGKSFPDGKRVAITDFGIARVLDDSRPEVIGGGLTRAGLLGTPEYMAPEQVTGGSVSPATDVYALGVVLYEMVTGGLPFSADTAMATAARRLREEVPRPELAAPGLDPRWSRTILRCLERESRRRFQSAGEVAAALSGSGRRRRWRLLAAGLLLLILAVAAGARLAHWPGPAGLMQGAPAAAQPSIAVLAFVDMSPEHDQEFFSDGVAQDIIGALAQVSGLHVAGRSSSFSFKGKNEDLRTVGQKLNVANVLEGSVRKAGSHLRVTAQLVNATSGYELWSQTFDRDVADVFAVQDEIAHAVVSALKLKVLSDADAAGRRVTNPEAYTHYLRGLQLENTGSMSGLCDATSEYRHAIESDTSYAPAHARLAWTLWYCADMQSTSTVDARMSNNLDALREANRAIELDPSGRDGYLSRGFLRAAVSWDWSGSREDLERAVSLSPGDARSRAWYGTILAILGQVPEAIAAAQTALELDPLSAEAHYWLASFYNAQGKYGEARELLKKALEIAPQYGRATVELAFTELLDGHPTEALALFRRQDQAWVKDFGSALAYYSLGNAEQSHDALDRLIANYTDVQYQIAQLYAWRGERDLAFAALERARHEHDAGIHYLKWDPFTRPLRTDPRFAALLESVKLPTD